MYSLNTSVGNITNPHYIFIHIYPQSYRMIRYKMKRFLATFNRFFGTCFPSPSHHKEPEISPLKVLLQPADHDPEQRDFSSADHFRADRRHKASTSAEELELGCVDAYSDLLTSHEELLNITHAAQLFFRRIFAQSFSLNDIFVKERVSSLNVTNPFPTHHPFIASLAFR